MPGWLAWLGLHAVLAALLTGWARRYAVRRRLLDQPGERRSHQVATPRGGGISVVACLLLATAWLGAAKPGMALPMTGFGLGLVLVAGIGWWDDHRPLSPLSRLLVHVLAAAALAAGLLGGGFGPWVAAAAFLLAVGLTNVWNFMDGIDGLAASQAGLVAAALAFTLPGPWSWLAAAMAAAVLGFLPFNFPKARIFLGDVGSGALGYALAALLASGLSGTPAIGWLAILVLPVTFLVDSAFTLLGRILQGERWWTPHVQHAYQRLARRLGHPPVTLAYAACSMLAAWAYVYGAQAKAGVVSFLFVSCYGLGVALWLAVRKYFD